LSRNFISIFDNVFFQRRTLSVMQRLQICRAYCPFHLEMYRVCIMRGNCRCTTSPFTIRSLVMVTACCGTKHRGNAAQTKF